MTDVMPASRPEMLDLEAKYTADQGEFFFTGIHALVRVVLEQLRVDRRNGLRTAGFVSGYQGSPLGGFDRELLARKALLDQLDVVHRPGLNEELGATGVMGSQLASTFSDARYDGVLGVWYGKAPGLDRASDAIRHGNYAGTSRFGGVLALVGDDPACKSSTLPSGSEHTLADLHLPTLFPGNVQEILDLGRHGVALSRACGLWTGVKVVTAVADGAGSAEVHPDRIVPVVPTVEYQGRPYVPQVMGNLVTPFSNEIEREIYEARNVLARLYAAANRGVNDITVDSPDAWLGIVSSGRTYYEVVEALQKLGLGHAELRVAGIRLLRVGMVSPLEPGIVRRFARGLAEIVIVEEKRPFLEVAVKDVLYGTTDVPRVVGKTDDFGAPLVAAHGALDADALVPALASRLRQRLDATRLRAPAAPPAPVRKAIDLLPNRTPFFCSGCPHNTGTKVPDGAVVGAGIGCHGMVMFMDPDRVGRIIGTTQMGGEGTQWIGIEPFVRTDHFTQNLGDGTYFHSGSLAVRAAVAAGSHVTYKILYNSAVAMTGGQDAAGAKPVPDLAGSLLLEGVAKVIITTDETDKYRGVRLAAGAEVWPRARIVEAQEELRKVPGVTVLIHDQQCAAEKRRDRKRGRMAEPARRIVINERVCEGCGDCGAKSNCLSVQPVDTEFGRKTRIHQSSCNLDYSCLAGDCPSFLTVVPRRSRRRLRQTDPAAARKEGGGRRRPALDSGDLPAPEPIVPVEEFTVRLPGIGGTGVVTVSQVLGTAAMLGGRYVWGLDQTGLSQKAGPVVSDLRISQHPLEGTNRVTAGEVDAYLVLDLLVGLAPNNVAGASPARTVVVASTSATPTGDMVTRPEAGYPAADVLRSELDVVTRAADNVYIDAAAVAEGLFGDTTTANMIVVGAAYQRGCLPISAEAIEQAIELNGAAVDVNKLAFRWGRMLVTDPGRVDSAMQHAEGQHRGPSVEDLALIGDLEHGELGRLLCVRVPDLVAYQDRAYAQRYLDLVRRAAQAEAAAAPGQTVLAEAVAGNLYKLMAYKDEYEVARLHLDATARLHVSNEVGVDTKISYNLHPPVLRSLGLQQKLRLGPWFTPALRSLQRGKRLRGTRLDPFGWANVRRVERELIDEYRAAIEGAVARLTPDNHNVVVELAGLPDLVRGYEQVKLNNVERFRTEMTRLRGELGI
jgi:indolepyruvate ferredoxin oxidoreductase